MPQPQPDVSGDLIDRLNALHQGSGPLNEMEQRRLLREIDKLKSVNPAAGLMTYGVYHAVHRDEAKAFEFHERSLNAAGRLPVYLMNFAITAANLSHIIKAFDLFAEALRKDPADAQVVLNLAKLSFYSCRAQSFADLLSLHLRASQEEQIMKNDEIVSACNVVDDLSSLSVNEEDALKVFSKVEYLLRAYDVKPSGASSELLNCGGHKYLNIELGIKAPAETLYAMNNELSDLVADDMEVGCWNKVVYSFVHAARSPSLEVCI
ncbi:hypothetical protein [Stutzerimonas nitrititolerans]|uniref:hypothetical protein n=1 Tax=Stutzerimonas nitrititolerans TaxID=2482751 RepID=UPI0028AB3EED|nr:hypothetical protein [Stutzerimonas nitrititolerans]